MAEFLDVYDANRNHIGTADRNVVHAYGLWHKTVHCWLVTAGDAPRVVFQRRARTLSDNAGKLYTTASGHVSAGESLEIAFNREIAQEIGVNIAALNPKHLYESVWIGDIKRKDGSMFIDRVFCNVYYSLYDGDISELKFEDGEVDGVVAIDLDEIIDFARGRTDTVKGNEYNGKSFTDVELTPADFVLVGNETVYDKFGVIFEKIKNDLNK